MHQIPINPDYAGFPKGKLQDLLGFFADIILVAPVQPTASQHCMVIGYTEKC